ncbi:MAG: NAD(P)H-dependent oxidoreductase [Pseudanabaena sp.]|jgi:putative NADPH-quinone reductase|nr:NAD(P)H-dependent oxidoreductase [Pseudanabaena sp. M172S2SP2A07QC]MCA6517574.1 NAD(P)H-dependent oxidoreductase [Pseudanabaena sp. M110S1SP2A07QC]MCA6526775.1 NAD(P)H-dependent oxidoreductase [Pseudanabaena sp. M179S2SP2A07QC]MCA6533660.1 NAD(P)H-dependent oxidoreductase [Pseudanabaena sp. M176S2SP2A07QC]MCA6538303.1 NAD(P)H-dependent oxidoreductase [Pseudanabaena sp. M037S2SP2A07QC]MCA6549427.1 NAD(P)H-dependent oxidoreductase [Pseudanabaena sp. M152S2SP2A07QC]MCA6555286.1 NAD(P)H-depend
MNKKILIVQGHPNPTSYCSALAEAYKKAAIASGAEVHEIVVNDLEFNFNPPEYQSKLIPELEEDVLKSQDEIRWAEHLVFVYPNWWGTMPTLLKAFIDRVFTSGFAFKYQKDSVWWDQLLKGKSARLIVTMDTPSWYYRFVYGQPGHTAMKKNILEFCGIKPVKITSIGSVKTSDLAQRQKWLKQVGTLGEKYL